jgi:hypothetical protein
MIDGVLFIERRQRIGIFSVEGFDELQGYFFGFHALRLTDAPAPVQLLGARFYLRLFRPMANSRETSRVEAAN